MDTSTDLVLREKSKTALRAGDPERAVGVVDTDLLSGLHVGLVGLVARADLDDGVGSVTRSDPHVTDAEFEHDGDRFGRLVMWHGCPAFWVDGLSPPVGDAVSRKACGAISGPSR